MSRQRGRDHLSQEPGADWLPSLPRLAAGRKRPAALSALVAILAYGIAKGLQLGVIRAAHIGEEALTWVADVALSAALGLVTYYWLHLRAARSELSRLERAQVVLDTQLGMAAEIQRGLLPRVPGRRNDWRFAVRFEPAGKVGGDFYDFLELPAEQLLIFVADVSGKGIPAALFLGVVRTLFRSLAAQALAPDTLMRRLSDELYAESGGAPYASGILAQLALDTGQLTYVNAGHPAGLVLGDGQPRLLDRGGPPIGLLPGTSYECEIVTLPRGRLVLLLTDGVSEAIESDRLSASEILAANPDSRLSTLNVDEVADAAMRLAREGSGPVGVSDWQDDRTVFVFGRVSGLELPPGGERRLESAGPATRVSPASESVRGRPTGGTP